MAQHFQETVEIRARVLQPSCSGALGPGLVLWLRGGTRQALQVRGGGSRSLWDQSLRAGLGARADLRASPRGPESPSVLGTV